jgi:hypothetical protein
MHYVIPVQVFHSYIIWLAALYLRDVFAKGPKYREPKSIKWKHNFKILMDSIENYARQHEKEDLDTKLAQELHNAYTKLRFTAIMSIYYIVKYNYSYDHIFFILRRYNIWLGHTQLQ